MKSINWKELVKISFPMTNWLEIYTSLNFSLGPTMKISINLSFIIHPIKIYIYIYFFFFLKKPKNSALFYMLLRALILVIISYHLSQCTSELLTQSWIRLPWASPNLWKGQGPRILIPNYQNDLILGLSSSSTKYYALWCLGWS